MSKSFSHRTFESKCSTDTLKCVQYEWSKYNWNTYLNPFSVMQIVNSIICEIQLIHARLIHYMVIIYTIELRMP